MSDEPTPTAAHQTHDEVLTRPWQPGERRPLDDLLEREWLVTNGLGGYASGTVSGAATRPASSPPRPRRCGCTSRARRAG